MTKTAELLEGVHLTELEEGAMIDINTKSRHYSVEYLGGDNVRVSGHPTWCPTPIAARLEGSIRDSGAFEPGFVGRGMHMVFQRSDDSLPVTTTEVKDLHLAAAKGNAR
jgi:hypothetical protein